MIGIKHRGGVKSSRSKSLQDFIIHHPEDNMSLRGAESSATKQSSLLSNVENFDDKTVNSASKKFEQVLNNATLKTVEKTAGLPRSQGYLLPRNDMRKAAFTLAEVLITLGIIGVVAALTLPTLISNYQKKAYVTQLKKSYAVMSNGLKLMMAHDGVTELKDATAFSNITGHYEKLYIDEYGNPAIAGAQTDTCGPNNILTDECRSIREGLQSVFTGIRFVPGDGTAIKGLNGGTTTNYLRDTRGTCIEFPDGSELVDYRFEKSGTSSVTIDLNGHKNPDTLGRDVFHFQIDNTGLLVPRGSKLQGDDRYWRTATAAKFTCKMDGTSNGGGCAGRVLEEDAMNY